MQGIPVRPQDIDILTTKSEAYRISRQLKEYETKQVRFRKSPLFRSYLGEFNVRGVKVEVMGDLRVRFRSRWVSLIPRLKNPRIVKLRDRNFPVTPLQEQLRSYKALGRRKDKTKIKKIEQFLNASKR
jgi:hypothetical protein